MTVGTIAIVGAGQAGGWAAQTLRREGHAGPVLLIGDEPHPPHERPPLSKAVLAGDASVESTYLVKNEAFAALALDWRPGVRATAIDRPRKRLHLSTGEAVGYDKLLLCQGGRARRLTVPGADLPGVLTLRTIDDAQRMAGRLLPGRHLVVIGGGWIGLEVAATARGKGMAVTVVEAASRLCERTVPPEISAYLARLHAGHGTEVLVGAGVERIASEVHGTLSVTLRDGRTLACDTVAVGVGLVPNDELAREAGLKCDGGIVVDAQCRTSDPDILAAGDVATAHCRHAGRRMRLESWQNAQTQGIAAACAALGRAVDPPPLPWFWSDQYGVNLQIHGVPSAADRVVARGATDADRFVLFYLDGDVVRAALGPNAARDLRHARRLIEQRTAVDPERLADVRVPMSEMS